jgi:hypothetical protein
VCVCLPRRSLGVGRDDHCLPGRSLDEGWATMSVNNVILCSFMAAASQRNCTLFRVFRAFCGKFFVIFVTQPLRGEDFRNQRNQRNQRLNEIFTHFSVFLAYFCIASA